VDLRLLGFAPTKRPFAELSRQVLPFTWAVFVLAVIAGSLLFISRATEYFVNPAFWIKMVLIVVAGVNMIIFEFITVRDVQKWNVVDKTPPQQARLAGGISIACWVLVVVFGRTAIAHVAEKRPGRRILATRSRKLRHFDGFGENSLPCVWTPQHEALQLRSAGSAASLCRT
jgi:uncharacterized membrane protein YcjF (UPF0283 family)